MKVIKLNLKDKMMKMLNKTNFSQSFENVKYAVEKAEVPKRSIMRAFWHVLEILQRPHIHTYTHTTIQSIYLDDIPAYILYIYIFQLDKVDRSESIVSSAAQV